MEDLWQYDPESQRYYFEGEGPGLTRAELDAFEDGVEAHEIWKRQRIAERSEY